MVGSGGYILAGGGWWWMAVDIFWLVVGGCGWWWVVVGGGIEDSAINRSSRSQRFFKIGAFKKFLVFTGKHLS